MCGRYSDPAAKAFEGYGLKLRMGYITSFNVSPGSFQPIIIKNSPLRIEYAKWGLIPSWSKDFKPSFTTFNARKEGLLESRVFKRPFLKQRCLVLAQAFYEWKTMEDGEKVRFVIKAKDRDYFSFAGFYDIWKDVESKEFYSYTLITGEPGPKVSKIHTREAVILKKDDEDKWLDKETSQDELMALLKPYPDELTETYPAMINSIKRDMDSEELLKPLN